MMRTVLQIGACKGVVWVSRVTSGQVCYQGNFCEVDCAKSRTGQKTLLGTFNGALVGKLRVRTGVTKSSDGVE